MNISAPFIARPVATTLITLGIALAGVLGFQLLPIAPLPQVDFPTISVQANLPGASPETMAATVATPLERALGSIAGVNEITSSSSLGSTRVTLQFDLSRDINGAARDVQAAINAARTLLPSGMPSNPTYRKVNPADAPIMILSLTSDTLTRGQMYDAASTVLAQRLAQVEGVGQVNVGGGALPAVRVELNPDKLAANGIALDNVRLAITATNANRPKGAVEEGARYWQVGANDQARTAADYAPVLLSYRNGAAVRLRDVAARGGGAGVAGRHLRRDVPRRLQPRQPVGDGAHGSHRLRRRRRDRRRREHQPPHRARHGAARRGAERRTRDRLHGGVDQPVTGGGVHSDLADGRRRRALVPRVRGGAVLGDPGVDAGVAHRHADDGRHLAEGPPDRASRARPCGTAGGALSSR